MPKLKRLLPDNKPEEVNDYDDDGGIVVTDKLDQIFLEESADKVCKVYSSFIDCIKSN